MARLRNVLGIGLVALLAFNATIAAPVAMRLSEDNRNAGYTLVAYRSLGVHPREITLDLWSAHEAAPIDLYRGLFQAAEALNERSFDRVTLARQGRPVFVLSGYDFAELGAAFSAGENPIYLIRTLPEKLHHPDGTAAYGTWEGGLLGVLGAQMNDVNDAALTWAEGH